MTRNSNEHNSSVDPTDNQDLLKIDSDISRHRKFAIFIILGLSVTYIIIFFTGTKLTEALQTWGTFGDFIGGILNPIFAFFAFYWLTYSVRLQINELKETRDELCKAATAQEESARHQKSIAQLEQSNVETQRELLNLQKQSLETQILASKAQQEQIALQNFESLFFELLKAKIDVTDNISYINKKTNSNESSSLESEVLYGKKAIERYIIDFKNNHVQSWDTYYPKNLLGQLGSYFRLNYQIIKLIHTNNFLKTLPRIEEKQYSEKQKEYFDILRATFNQYELEAFFFNCLSPYGNGKFKNLVENYGLFEPILIEFNQQNLISHPLTRYAYNYNSNIFEKNKSLIDYFNNLNKIKLNIDTNILGNIFEILIKLGIAIIHKNHRQIIYEKNYLNQITSLYLNENIDIYSFENIKNIKKQKKSDYFVAKNEIYNLKNQISDIINKKYENLKNINSVDIYSSISEERKIYNNAIKERISKVKNYQKQLENNNLYFEELLKLNEDIIFTAIYLIKYKILYSEFSEFMKNKEIPN